MSTRPQRDIVYLLLYIIYHSTYNGNRSSLTLLGSALLCACLVAQSAAQELTACVCVPKKTIVNEVGEGAELPISNTAATVLNIKDAACQRLVWNKGLGAVRCLSKNQGTPTPTAGLMLQPGEQMLMGTAGREAWWCIRTTSVDGLIITIEEVQ